jgi:serine/threonine protein kinase
MDFGPSTQQFDAPPTHEALPAGTRLGGYQIIEVLGRGGFGIVYLALDSSLQRQVAIKEYLPADTAMRCDDQQVWVKPGADPGAYAAGKTAFLNEAKMLARFDHPSLARVHSFWEENRTAYMVMPYYEGRTLAKVLADMPQPPDEAWLRTLLGPLLGGLSVLHHSQCLHLDISPDNIIVLHDGRPVLLDFGVASRLATDKTIALTSLLNPAYAPIEQYSESITLPQGPWSDLYALAGVLHFAIAGRPPARATVRALDDPQRPLAETVQGLQERFPGLAYSASFLHAIDKALAVRPRDRPRDVAEFQSLLERQAGEAPMSYGHAASYGQAGTSAFDMPAAEPVPPLQGFGGRSEPLFQAPPPRDEWVAHERSDAPIKPARSHTAWWVAGVCTLALAGVGGWAWLQRQPAQAQISVTDLPPAVVASVPPPPGRAASAVAPDAAQERDASAAVVAQDTAASAAAIVAQASAVPAAPVASAPAAPAASAAAPNLVAAAPPARSAAPAAPMAPVAPAPDKPVAAKKPVPEKKAPVVKKAPEPAPAVAAAVAGEPNNPRAVCGSRSNFALVYCMQTQCKRPKFSTHPQCMDMRQRGEL